jgi:hypothetical protein
MQIKRWVCPQCFTSIRDVVLAHRERPFRKCQDHFNLDWVEIVLYSDAQAEIEASKKEADEAFKRAGDRWKLYDTERQDHLITKAELTAARAEIEALRLYKDCTYGIESAREKEIAQLIMQRDSIHEQSLRNEEEIAKLTAENKRLREIFVGILARMGICNDLNQPVEYYEPKAKEAEGIFAHYQAALKEDDECQCPACSKGILHDSDCAVHNIPSYPNGECCCKQTNEPKEGSHER